jgi:serine/threonine protein kinase
MPCVMMSPEARGSLGSLGRMKQMVDPDVGDLFELVARLGRGQALPSIVPLFGRYRASRLLGMGGTSIVLEARDEVLGRPVALKIWSPDLVSRSVWAASTKRYSAKEEDFFRQEARNLASIAHPALCGIHDFGTSPDGIPWMALEYIPGSTLRAKLREWREGGAEARLSEILDIFQQIADAVAFLHSSSLWQLDLKPENVILDGSRVRLIDFATSLERPSRGYRIERARHGTPGYVAPEMFIRHTARSEPIVTPAADVFSLAVILLEMLTLENPLATEALQRAAYEALGIVEREIYLDYTTAVFMPDFEGRLAPWAAGYLEALRAIDMTAKTQGRLTKDHPELAHLLRTSLSELPEDRPADGATVVAQLASIRTIPPVLGPVFISHAHDDKLAFVDSFVKALTQRSVSVWYDSFAIRVGEPFWDRIFTGLQQARFVIVVLSHNAISSSGVREELRYAHLENVDRVKILPILIDETKFESLPPSLRSRQILRFPRATSGGAFQSAVDDLVKQMRDLDAGDARQH